MELEEIITQRRYLKFNLFNLQFPAILTQKVILNVKGMTCSGCVNSIESSLLSKKVFFWKSIDLDNITVAIESFLE